MEDWNWETTFIDIIFGKHVLDFLIVLIERFSLGVTAEVLRAKIDRTRSSAIAERPHCSLFKLWQKYKREQRASGLFFLKSSGNSVEHALSRFTHYVYASFCHVTYAPCAPCRTQWPFLSVLIGFHVIHPNTSLSSVNQHLLLKIDIRLQ